MTLHYHRQLSKSLSYFKNNETRDLAKLWTTRVMLQTGAYREIAQSPSNYPEQIAELLGLVRARRGEDVEPKSQRALLKGMMRSIYKLEEKTEAKDGVLRTNIKMLGELIGLNTIEQSALAFVFVYQTEPLVSSTFEGLGISGGQLFVEVMALMLDMDPEDLDQALSNESTLIRAGLVHLNHRDQRSFFATMSGLRRALMRQHPDTDSLISFLLTKPTAPGLQLKDFAYCGDNVDLSIRLMKNALQIREEGVNLLFFGAPGTGKTELARLIAQEANASLQSVRVDDRAGEPISPSTRLSSFSLMQRIFHQKEQTILLFDEIEEVFPRPRGMQSLLKMGPSYASTERKGWVNRVLEENPVPTIWIANALDG
ncbi:ATP-binding protein, partial [Myxococcota bacterium]|nr:ATP-binding protein [Myxococcota bacterium]